MIELAGTHPFAQVAAMDAARPLRDASVALVVAGGVICALLIAWAVRVDHQRNHPYRPLLFTLIALTASGVTVACAVIAVTLSLQSPERGPVEWEAAVHVWACDSELLLRSPSGPSGQLGTSTLFTRGDRLMHVEGIPTDLGLDASLGGFMQAIGGSITSSNLVVPLSDSMYTTTGTDTPPALQPYVFTTMSGTEARFMNGETCGSAPSTVQLFAYVTDPTTHEYRQEKIAQPATYQISHYSSVPPGDCLVVEFGPERAQTTHTCAPRRVPCQPAPIRVTADVVCPLQGASQ